jgi:hypothetical protein
MNYSPTDIARQFLFVREADVQNTGLRVEAIQHWSSGNKGDSWCCEFVTMVLDICYQGAAPIPRLQACQDVYDLAQKNNWLTSSPVKDDIYIFVNSDDHAHHIGIITADGGAVGIAGNTSADGTSSDGDRVAEHQISTNPATVKYIHYQDGATA